MDCSLSTDRVWFGAVYTPWNLGEIGPLGPLVFKRFISNSATWVVDGINHRVEEYLERMSLLP